MRLQPRGMVKQNLCNHVFTDPVRCTKLHSIKECKLCGYEVVVRTPEVSIPEQSTQCTINVEKLF
jgi:hypothetical protein